MRNFFKLLSPLLLAALFISCAQSVKQNGSISFDGDKIVFRAVQYSINKSRSPETGGDEEEFTPEMEEALKAALEFTATLSMEINSEDKSYHKTAEEDYDIDYSSAAVLEKKTIKFEDVPVGIKATIDAKITSKIEIKDDDAFASLLELWGMPPEELTNFSKDDILEMFAREFHWSFVLYGKAELTVHEGENPVTLKMSYNPNGNGEGGEEDIPVDGIIEIEKPVKLTITIDQEKSDSKYYLNKGKIFFTLLDENGNDILEDVDWDAYSDIYGFINQNLLAVDCELYYGHNKINGLLNYGMNYLTMDNAYPLPKGGSYQLSFTISPGKRTYVNNAGQTVDFPDFEPVTGSFEVEVEDAAYYSLSVDSREEDYIDFNYWTVTDNIARSELENVTSNIYLHLYGEYQGQLESVFTNMHDWMNSKFSDKPYIFVIDTSEVTTSTEFTGLASYVLQDLKMMKSIIMPDCATTYSTAIFGRCTNLEYVKFGNSAKSLDVDCDGAEAHNLFLECTSLRQVQFANTEGWYNSETIINSTIDWSSLSPIDVSNPEINVENIKNGNWKYLYRKTE